MRVRYTLTSKEWREGRQLAREKHKGSSISLWVWACIVMPVLGSIGEIVHSVRQSKDTTYRGSLVPTLLLLAGTTVAAIVVVRWRRERALEARDLAAAGEVEVEISEAGVRFCHPDREVDAVVQRVWGDFDRIRVGQQVLVLIHVAKNGHDTLPQRAFTQEQLQWMQRLCARKLRPARDLPGA